MRQKIEAYMASREPACDICGATARLAVGSTHSKSIKLTMRCPDHMKTVPRLRKVYALAHEAPDSFARKMDSMAPPNTRGGTINIDSEQQNIDAGWFAAHPHRTHMARAPSQKELDGCKGGVELIIVRQHEPGMRSKCPVSSTNGYLLPDDDETLAVIYDKLWSQGSIYESEIRAEVVLRSILGGKA